MAIKCNECGASFKTIRLRNRHLRIAHNKCDVCNLQFQTQASYNFHISRAHNDILSERVSDRKIFKCEHCALQFLNKHKRDRHVEKNHLVLRVSLRCPICKEDFPNFPSFQLHKQTKHNTVSSFNEVQGAFRKNCYVTLMQIPYEGPGSVQTVDQFYHHYTQNVIAELSHQLSFRTAFKVWLVLYADIYKMTDGQIEEYDTFYCRSSREDNLILNEADISYFIEKSKESVGLKFQSLRTNGSDWLIHGITACSLEIANARPLNGACITNKVTIRNVSELNNIEVIYNDNRQFKDGCLFYAVASYFVESEDLRHLDHFIKHKLNIEGIKTPVSLHHLTRFEEQNSDLDFKINVLEVVYEKSFNQLRPNLQIYPLRSNIYKSTTHIINVLWVRFYSEILVHKVEDRNTQFHEFGAYGENLDFFADLDTCDSDFDDSDLTKLNSERFLKSYGKRGHFMLITNLSEFLRYRDKRYICVNCLNGFKSFEKFELHENFCMKFKPCLVEMPLEGTKVKFGNFNNKFRLPYVFFYDFECILVPDQSSRCFNCIQSEMPFCNHKSKVINKQIPASYVLVLLDDKSNILETSVYTGQDCVRHFLYNLFTFKDKYITKLHEDKLEMIITSEQQKEFELSTHCYICELPFCKQSNLGPKVRDHSKVDGLYLGSCHQKCNLKRQETYFIPAVAHNNMKFDFHFVLSELDMITKPSNISALPLNSESFKTFSVYGIHFIDSYAFLNLPLNKLADDLRLTPNYEYKILKSLPIFSDENKDEEIQLLLSKQFFPYEYISSFSKLNETKLPPKESFFSLLTNKGITDDEYKHACYVFDTFKCENLRQYSELYCLIDTILLCEIVMHFREIIFNDGGLDLFHYISLPQLSWDLALKLTGLEIELIHDCTMYSMLEQNIRGGVVFAGHRYMENNIQDKSTDIIYVDMNSLYGLSMKSLLPYSDYQWVDLSVLEQIDWLNIDTQSEIGYILLVDLDYPVRLHDDHDSFPVAPISKTVSYDLLSPYAKQCLFDLQNKSNYKAEKLIASLESKKEYLVHFANLQYYLSLGLVLKKIHTGFSFKQKAIFADYITYCTEKRRTSVSKFQASIFKTLCNSIFGKTLETVRDRLSCSFVTNPSFCRKYISENGTISFRVLNENLVCIFKKQKRVSMIKPICTAFTILENSKLAMYKMYYDKLRPRFALMKCIYSDTDSFVLKVVKFFKDYDKDTFEIISDLIDFSNYPISHPLYDVSKKNALGFLKNEMPALKIIRFLALRSKSYCIELDNNQTIRKAKGISYNYQKNLTFQSYLDCLLNIQGNIVSQYQIRSYNHKIVTQKLNKTSMSSFDDKRFIFACGICSVAYGHYKVDQFGNNELCPMCNNSVM